MYENRRYVIFNATETGSIDFSQVMEDSADTLRFNVSGSRWYVKKTFVKYEGSQPSSVAVLSSKSEEYTHSQISTILTGSDWSHSEGM